MKIIWDFLVEHRGKASLIAYWIFTSAVHTMPHPALTHGFYSWAYAFLHVLAGGILTNGGMK